MVIAILLPIITMPRNILPKDPYKRIEKIAGELYGVPGDNSTGSHKKKPTIAFIAKKYGASPGTVNVDAWIYKNLSVDALDELRAGRLTYSKARILAAYTKPQQDEYLSYAVEKGVNGKALKEALESKIFPRIVDDGFLTHPETRKTAELMSTTLGINVEITSKKNQYQLEAKYISNERAIRTLIALNLMNENLAWDSVFTGIDASTKEPTGIIIIRFSNMRTIIDYLTKVSELIMQKNKKKSL